MPSDPEKRREQQRARREAERLKRGEAPATSTTPTPLAPPEPLEAPANPPPPASASAYRNEGARLLARATKAGGGRLTDTELAGKLGTSRMTLYRWIDEGATPRPTNQARALAELGIPLGAWTAAPQPDPPPRSLEDIRRELGIDRDFLHFLEHGPAKLRPTKQQRVLVKIVFQRQEPGDLAGEEREIARVLFGNVDTIPPLARRRNVLRLGKLSGKSTIAGAWVAWSMLTADLSELGTSGDVPVAILMSRRAKTTRIVFRFAAAFLRGLPAVEDSIESDTSTDLLFTRPTDGRSVQLSTVVRSPGGDAARGMWILCAVIDEAEFTGETKGEESAIQDIDNVIAFESRYLPGAALFTLSTPWPATSWAGEAHMANWGAPVTALCAQGATLFLRDGDEKIAARRDAMYATDPKDAAREFDCICGSSTSDALIPPDLVDAAVKHFTHRTGERVSAGFDAGFQGDPSALAVVERQGERVVVVDLAMRVPGDQPLVPSIVCRELFGIARARGADHVACDNHEQKTVENAAAESKVWVRILSNKAQELACGLRDLFVERRIDLPGSHPLTPLLVMQLKALRIRHKPGRQEYVIERPRTPTLYHCDLASALECAANEDATFHGAFAGAAVDLPARFEERPPSEYAKSGPAVPYRHPDPRINQSVAGGPALIQVRGLWRGIT